MQKKLKHILLLVNSTLASMAFCYLNSINPSNVFIFGCFLVCVLLLKIKFDCRSSISIRILSVVLSALLLLGKYLVFLDETVGYGFWIRVIITFIGSFLFFEEFFAVLFSKLDKIQESREQKIRSTTVFIVSFIFMIFSWVPAWIAEYPGIFTPDTIAQLNQVEGLRAYNNFNPFIYTIFIKLCRVISSIFTKDVNMAYFSIGMVQMIVLAAVYAYANVYAYERTRKTLFPIFGVLFYSLTSYNVFYSITISKDSMYAAFALLFVIMVDKYGNNPSRRNAVLFVVTGVLYSLLRKNGFYSLLFTFLILIILSFKQDLKKILLVLFVTLVIACAVENPVYGAAFNMLNSNSVVSANENYLIRLESTTVCNDLPTINYLRGENTRINGNHFRGNFLYVMFFQQVANVVCHDRPLTSKQVHMIEELIPISVIKKTYDPMLVDELFNAAAAYATREAENLGFFGYLKLWSELFVRYPQDYLEAYVNMTKYYFYPNRFVNTYYIGIHDNEIGIKTIESDASIYKKKLEAFYNKKQNAMPILSSIYSAGTFSFVLFAVLFYVVRRKNYVSVISLLPLLGNFLILMACVPINDEFRYMYPLVVCLPYYAMLFVVKDTEIETPCTGDNNE